MRTQEEIQDKINELESILNTGISYNNKISINASVNVLENGIEYDEIKDLYFDGNKTYRELYCNSARKWLDGEIDNIEINF